MIDELASHGYRLSPGTLYPMLHTMEQRVERAGRSTRKFYRATEFGLQGLALAKVRVREFTGETLGQPRGNEATDERRTRLKRV
jgi:DNA-binding PadR family transcriptional regulator